MVSGKTLALDLLGCETVGVVKALLEKESGIPADQQRLLFEKKETLNQNNVDDHIKQETATVELVVVAAPEQQQQQQLQLKQQHQQQQRTQQAIPSERRLPDA